MSEKIKSFETGFLFSDPTFLKGAGTVFNVWGNYYIFNYSPEGEADQRAIASDWLIIGNDFRSILGKTENYQDLNSFVAESAVEE